MAVASARQTVIATDVNGTVYTNVIKLLGVAVLTGINVPV